MTQTNLITSSIGLSLALILLPQFVLGQSDRDLQYFRPYDQRGLSTFETPVDDTVGYDGVEVVWGAGFTQQFQALEHSSDAPVDLPEIGPGFNLATANLNLDAQLARGVRVNLITYLSSRHHPEAWVKGGYVQMDELPMLDVRALNRVMQYVTIRAGHFEINYGDAHFRRTDNGHALYNPFVGNYILDAFTTEIGGEVYVRSNGFLAMAAATGGEINGGVERPDDRAPSFYGKLGVDREVNPGIRLRLTASGYTTSKSVANHLHSGDRAGSRYYSVLEGGDWSGRVRGNFNDAVTAFMLNPFVKYRGLELFGTVERVSGSREGLEDGYLTQYAAEAIYRFAGNSLFAGVRYNVVNGDLLIDGSWTGDITVDRWQIGAGWFATRSFLVKAEYVTQNYDGFPLTTVRHGGRFSGFMLEGVIAF